MAFLFKTTGVAFFCLATDCAHGQQNLFQSASGDTSLFLSGGAGVVSYNLGDSTARFDFLRDSGGRFALGGGIGATIKAGSGNIINRNSPAAGGTFDVGVIVRKPPEQNTTNQSCSFVENTDQDLSKAGPTATTTGNCKDKKYLQYAVAQLQYGRTQFYNLASAIVPFPGPVQVNFDQFRGTLAYNSLLKTDAADYRFGLAFTPGTANNLSGLDEQSYQQQVTTQTSSTQSTLSSSSKTVYVGAYKTHLAEGLNADVVIQPGGAFHYELGFDLMLRSDFGGGTGVAYASPGLGIYFFKVKAPVVPIGGLAYSYRSGKSQVAITLGWTFGGAKPLV